MNKYYSYLNKVITSAFMANGDYDELCKMITKDISGICSTARVGTFLFKNGGETLDSNYIFIQKEDAFAENISLPVKSYPIYFDAIASDRSFIVNDVYQDERTQEFVESYFPNFGITSMLDCAIRFGDQLVGVICLEHIGEKREWEQEVISFVGSIGDLISKCYTLNQQREAQEQLLVKSKLITIGQTSAQILHEIASPLTALQSQVRLCQRYLMKDDPDKLAESLQKVATINDHVMSVFKSMRTILAGDNSAKSTISFMDLMIDIQILVDEKLEDHKIEFNSICTSEDTKILANPGMLGQVLMNLINNAAEEVKDKESRWIKLELKNSPTESIINVIDSGKGIDPEAANTLFDLLYTTKSETSGTGLGLHICKTLIEKQDGEIRVNTNHDNTCFEIKLPKK